MESGTPDDYDLGEHIHRLVLVTGFEGVFDQRQVTINTYATNLPFEPTRIRDALAGAWLAPDVHLGVVQFLSPPIEPEIRVVLGYQAESRVRTFDYANRRAQWWAWRPTIRDTIAIRYSADSGGMLRFTTIGGGLRIKAARLRDFHAQVLGIAKDASRTLSFDPRVLGQMWFEERFVRTLYSLKARLLDAKRYGSIEHAEFASQRFLDPDCDVLVELRAMRDLPVEAFESIVSLNFPKLGGALTVRFAIRATSGALRLNLPTFEGDPQFQGDEEQTKTFYDFVEKVAAEVVRPEMFLLGQIDPALADPTNSLFPEQIDTAEYREYLRSPETRKTFFDKLNTSGEARFWVPHLHATDELLAGDLIAAELQPVVLDFSRREPRDAIAILNACRRHAWLRTGALVRDCLAASLPDLPYSMIMPAEEAILDYGFEHDNVGWDVDHQGGELIVHGLGFPLADLRPLAAARGLLLASRCLHDKISGETFDADLMFRLSWALFRIPRLTDEEGTDDVALTLLTRRTIPRSLREYRHLHPRGTQPSDADGVEAMLLTLHRLPLWPAFEGKAGAGGWTIKNVGMGRAASVRVSGDLVAAAAAALAPGDELAGAWPRDGARPSTVQVTFVKAGVERSMAVRLEPAGAPAGALFDGQSAQPTATATRAGPRKLDRRQIAARMKDIDPSAMPIGGSRALLGVMEQILRVNLPASKPAPVLLLGETGVGKTTFFRLLHAASDRRGRSAVIASGSEGAGGDPALQRGVWFGYGKNHGLPGIPIGGQGGKLDEARGSTMFIDDFEGLGLGIQADFLAVLEGRPVGRVGKGSPPTDVRVVLATNADPDALVRDNRLRHDLLARIPAQNRIVIPPLRERPEDVLSLARAFAKAEKVRLTDRAYLVLFGRVWPDNVRELQSLILTSTQDVRLVGRSEIDVDDLCPSDAERSEVMALPAEEVERALWTVARTLALEEGYLDGSGLQGFAADLIGVSHGEASKVFARLGWRSS